MDPTSWSAYSQHLSRLGASINHSSGTLSQQAAAQMSEMALSSPLQRQEHISGYGNAGGPHPFLLAASHGLNPSQANHTDPAFNANLFANYDASLFSSSFPPGSKGHLPFPQGAAGLFKAVNRENEFGDLRTGFSHCAVPGYARNSEANNGLPSGSGHLFQNSMPPGSWRHSGIIPPQCGPFGVLPHETVLQRSHLVARASDKLSVQASKQARSMQNSSYVDQDLGRGYRTIRSSSSYVDGGNATHSSLLPPQNDPFFPTVNENFYSSCSKNDFAAYSSYCSNVQRGSMSSYCYSQGFANFEHGAEKQDSASPSRTSSSANAKYSNFVPNVNGNPSHIPNGQTSRQSVITSNISNNSMNFVSESHPNASYNMKETFPYHPTMSHPNAPSMHANSNTNVNNNSRAATVAAHNTHSNSQPAYPPMSTPIPASTPAHTTPPTSIGQAYVPIPLPLSHDSGCSSVNSQSMMYHSPSNDGCYSTSGTCPSESGSPAKHDLSRHSSPSIYSIDGSNLSMNSGPFSENQPMRAHSNSEGIYSKNCIENGGISSDMECIPEAEKMAEQKLQNASRPFLPPDMTKNAQVSPALPIDMVKNAKETSFEGSQHSQNDDQLSSCMSDRSDSACKSSFSKLESEQEAMLKRGHKRKFDDSASYAPLNCTYTHLRNSQQLSPSSESSVLMTDKSLDPSVEMESLAVDSNNGAAASSSPAPVDLSQVTMNSKKCEESSGDSKNLLSDLNYDSTEANEKWTDQKPINPDSEKVQHQDSSENASKDGENKNLDKHQSPICQPPPLDELSDESKKLCTSIDDDLGFLEGLSSDPDIDDNASKGSFSSKKIKKDPGILQSFLTYLENSNEPPPVSTDRKAAKQEDSEPLKPPAEKKTQTPSKAEDLKSGHIESSNDKDNFDETPSLDPSLFGCANLQKEMVVPNPEAPSFSSDEDENSTQGIFDSVAMAIQRLCEDNEEDHCEKVKMSSVASSQPGTSNSVDDESKAPMPGTSTEKPPVSLDEEKVEVCGIKSTCVVKPRKGKRRKAKHLLVIKVKRTDDKPKRGVKKTDEVKKGDSKPAPVQSEKPKPLRSSPREVQVLKTVQKSSSYQRRTPSRKCKERHSRKKSTSRTRRKRRSCTKKKDDDEAESVSSEVLVPKEEQSSPVTLEEKTDVIDTKPVLPKPEVVIPKRPAKTETAPKLPPCTALISGTDVIDTKPVLPKPEVVIPKKPAKTETSSPKRPRQFYRGHRRRRRGPKRHLPAESSESLPKSSKSDGTSSNSLENSEIKAPQKASSTDAEVNFKTGEFVRSIESKNCEKPPIWRIEGKNVLQLFEPTDSADSKVLYRNTSSYSRWSPSSKHKYSKQPVKVIKADDDSVIVELLSDADQVVEKEPNGSCDFTVHPQRENFEVYLQTLVSQVLDPEFLPIIIKENDEYFLSHLKAIEDVTSSKKKQLAQADKWDSQLMKSLTTYPYVSVSKCQKENESLCQICSSSQDQFTVHFHGQIYDPVTLENKAEGQGHPVCDFNFPLCGGCVQIVTLYSRLHHHKYHFYQLSCKKVKDINQGIEKPSHTVLEECLQDLDWVSQMFKDMLEMWNACDKNR